MAHTTTPEVAALARAFDTDWLAAARRTAAERIATSAFTLTGLLALGWDAPPLALFVVAGFAITLGGDVALWLGARAALEDGREQARAAEAVLERLRPTATRREDGHRAARTLSPAGELVAAAWLVATLIGAVFYELARSGGFDLLAWVRGEPLTLASLAAILAWQVLVRWRLARRARAGTATLHPGTDCFTPLLDAVLYFVVLFLWLAGMTIAHHVASGLFYYDVRPHGLAAFVVVAHALYLWRGVVELRAARARRDEVAALAQARPASPG
ncbi:MAG: hypothetical protein H6977_12875 [Gammaproteobacteria bacterium]|nr:hypothetical protein [Gammaproteobacteria bacterium]MCP5200901.1 hypothetical protein [Gammaproteobacteria bacterium]